MLTKSIIFNGFGSQRVRSSDHRAVCIRYEVISLTERLMSKIGRARLICFSSQQTAHVNAMSVFFSSTKTKTKTLSTKIN